MLAKLFQESSCKPSLYINNAKFTIQIHIAQLKRFVLFDLLKSLYSDTMILSLQRR